jgi:hypothetical protein
MGRDVMVILIDMGCMARRVFTILQKKCVSLQAIMNRLEYWIKAQTQYRVHSPFVFEMYRKVLFAGVDKEALDAFKSQLPADGSMDRRDWRYLEIVYKMQDYYGLRMLCFDMDEAVMEGEVLTYVKVVCRPHRFRARELRWMAQQGNAKYNVSIDLYDVGVLFNNPKMHRQHFVLR